MQRSVCEMADRFKTLVDDIATEISLKKKILEEQEARIEAEKTRLEKEKETMSAVSVSDNDVVHLNVGGHLFSTFRGSLRLVSLKSSQEYAVGKNSGGVCLKFSSFVCVCLQGLSVLMELWTPNCFQVEGSVLELMFSGRWENRIAVDKSGNAFLDMNPILFGILLRFLSAMHTYGLAASHLRLQPVPLDLEDEFRLMINFLGLTDLLAPKVPFK